MKTSTQKCTLVNKSLCALTLSALLGIGAVAPSLASGGSNAGGIKAGGTAAGGGGGNAGGVKDPAGQGVVVTLSNGGIVYNGAPPKGTVTLGYAADGTSQSIAFSLSSLKVQDGSVLPVRVIVGTLQTIFTYYQTTQVVYTEVDGSITVNHSSASLSLSKANGDIVPNFAPPTTAAGTTEIQVLSPDGTTLLLDGIVGSFHA